MLRGLLLPPDMGPCCLTFIVPALLNIHILSPVSCSKAYRSLSTCSGRDCDCDCDCDCD